METKKIEVIEVLLMAYDRLMNIVTAFSQWQVFVKNK